MKEINYWTDNKKRNNVNSKLPNCAAKNYFVPTFNKILTEIKPDDEDFVPIYCDNNSKADIKANLPEDQITLYAGGHAVIDCGFYVEVPSGYKLSVCTKSNYLHKGIFIKDIINDNGRIKVLIINNNEKTITIKHKDIIGEISIEPVYFFEWEIK